MARRPRRIAKFALRRAGRASRCVVRTFHAVRLRARMCVLRDYSAEIGFDAAFTIHDQRGPPRK